MNVPEGSHQQAILFHGTGNKWYVKRCEGLHSLANSPPAFICIIIAD